MTELTGGGGVRASRGAWGWALGLAGVMALVALGLAVTVGSLLEMRQVAAYLDLGSASPLLAFGFFTLAGGAAALIWRYPGIALGTIVALLPWELVGGSSGARTGLLVAKAVLVAAIGGFMVVTWVRRWPDIRRFGRTPLGRAFAAWGAFVVGGIGIGLISGYPAFHVLREGSWYAFYLLIPAVAVTLEEPNKLRRVVALLVLVCVLAQFDAFRVYATGPRYARGEFADFFRAPYSQTTSFALLVTLAYSVLAIWERQRTAAAVLLPLTGLFAVGAFLSFGRAEWVADGLAVVVTLLAMLRGVPVVSALGGLLLVALVVGSGALGVASLLHQDIGPLLGMAGKFAGAVSGAAGDASLSGRASEVYAAFVTWLSQPFGAGFGAPILALPDSGQNAEMPYYIHNSYMNTLVKLGPAGLVVLLWLLWATARTAWGEVRRATTDPRRLVLGAALLGYVVKAAAISLLVPVLSTSDAIANFALVAGMVAAVAHAARVGEVVPR